MIGPGKAAVKKLREKYPAGTRIRLIQMEDAQAPPPGTEGTVRGVDDAGSILMSWDSGSSLSIIPEVDTFSVIKKGGKT